MSINICVVILEEVIKEHACLIEGLRIEDCCMHNEADKRTRFIWRESKSSPSDRSISSLILFFFSNGFA